MPSKLKWLEKASKQWEDSQIITPEQRLRILAGYEPDDLPAVSRVQLVLYILGTITIGLGIILWFAANWPYLTKPVKLALIGLALVSCYSGSFYFLKKQGESSKAGQSLLLLGGMLYAAAIWLIAQIFNLSSDLSPGLLLWLLGIFPLVFVIKTSPILVLSSLVAFAWSAALKSEASPLIYLYPVIAFLLLWVSVRYRSQLAVSINLSGLGFWLLLIELWAGWIFYGIALIAIAFRSDNLLKLPSFIIGWLLAFGQSFFYTYRVHNRLYEENLINSLILLGLALVVLVYCGLKAEGWKQRILITSGLVAAVFLVLGYYNLAGWLIFWSNLFLLVVLYIAVIYGMKTNRIFLLNLAIILFFVELIARYSDLAWAMKLRSLFFVVGGLLLIITGFLVNKGREKLIRRAEQGND